MKRKKIFYLMLILLLPIFINAEECTNKELGRLRSKLGKVEIVKKVTTSGRELSYYTIRVVNIPEGFYLQIGDDISKYKPVEGEFAIPEIPVTPSGTTYHIKIVPDEYSICYGEPTYRKIVNLNYVNYHSLKKECQDYPKFKHCDKNIKDPISDEEFNSLLKEYKKIEKPVKKKKNYDYIFIGVILLFISFLLLALFKKRWSKITVIIFLLFMSTNVLAADGGASGQGDQFSNSCKSGAYCGLGIGYRLSMVKVTPPDNVDISRMPKTEKIKHLKRVGFLRDFHVNVENSMYLDSQINTVKNAYTVSKTRIDELKDAQSPLVNGTSLYRHYYNTYPVHRTKDNFKFEENYKNVVNYVDTPVYKDVFFVNGLTCLFGNLRECPSRAPLKKTASGGAYQTYLPSPSGNNYLANFSGMGSAKTRKLFLKSFQNLSVDEVNNFFAISGADRITEDNKRDYYVQVELLVRVTNGGSRVHCYGTLYDAPLASTSSKSPIGNKEACTGSRVNIILPNEINYEFLSRSGSAAYGTILYQSNTGDTKTFDLDKHNIIPRTGRELYDGIFNVLPAVTTENNIIRAMINTRYKNTRIDRFNGVGAVLMPYALFSNEACPIGETKEIRIKQEEYCNKFVLNKQKNDPRIMATRAMKEECLIGQCKWNPPKPKNKTSDAKCTFTPAPGAEGNSSTGYYDQSLVATKTSSELVTFKDSSISAKYDGLIFTKKCDWDERISIEPEISSHYLVTNADVNSHRDCSFVMEENSIRYLEFKMAGAVRPAVKVGSVNGRAFNCDLDPYCKTLKNLSADSFNGRLNNDLSNYKITIDGTIQYADNTTGPLKYDLKNISFYDRTPYKSNIVPAGDAGITPQTINYFFKNINGNIVPNTKGYRFFASAATKFYTPKMYIDYKTKKVKKSGFDYESMLAYYSEKPISNVSFEAKLRGFACGSAKKVFKPDTFCRNEFSGNKCYGDDPSSTVYSPVGNKKAGINTSDLDDILDAQISNNNIFNNQRGINTVTVLNGQKVYTKITENRNNNDVVHSCETTITVSDRLCEKTICEINPKGGVDAVKIRGKSYDAINQRLYIKQGMPFTDYELKNLRKFDGYYVTTGNIDLIKSPYSKYVHASKSIADMLARKDIYYAAVCLDQDCKEAHACYAPQPPKDNCFTALDYGSRTVFDSGKKPDNGKYFDVKSYCLAKHKSEDGTDGSYEACISKCYEADEDVIYRNIDYDRPFNDRRPGKNWLGREGIISSSKNYVKNHRPIYHLSMNNTMVNKLRRENFESLSLERDIYTELNPFRVDFESAAGYYSFFIHKNYREYFLEINERVVHYR